MAAKVDVQGRYRQQDRKRTISFGSLPLNPLLQCWGSGVARNMASCSPNIVEGRYGGVSKWFDFNLRLPAFVGTHAIAFSGVTCGEGRIVRNRAAPPQTGPTRTLCLSLEVDFYYFSDGSVGKKNHALDLEARIL